MKVSVREGWAVVKNEALTCRIFPECARRGRAPSNDRCAGVRAEPNYPASGTQFVVDLAYPLGPMTWSDLPEGR